MLNQPIRSRFQAGQRVLVAGAGGGYDVVCALPVFFALEAIGCDVHLASLSSAPLADVAQAVRHTESLVEVTAASTRPGYFPEGWLARWFAERRGHPLSLWTFEATGVLPYHASYAYLARRLKLDAIVLVDGGIDSLLRGDEYSLGTPLWDALTLGAVNYLETPEKILVTTAFGAERWDDISHAQALARIADLTHEDALLGVASLLRTTPEGAAFIEAAEYLFANQAYVRQSVVAAAMMAALRGDFGERPVGRTTRSSPIWISPLLSLYWFFDLSAVAAQKRFLPRLLSTHTVTEAADRLQHFFDTHPRLPRESIPI